MMLWFQPSAAGKIQGGRKCSVDTGVISGRPGFRGNTGPALSDMMEFNNAGPETYNPLHRRRS